MAKAPPGTDPLPPDITGLSFEQALAGRQCGGRLVSTLEGGYDLAALAASAAVHVRELMAVS
jgi:acetoin utilization deacetylase AcuC-like enzyme